MAKIKNMKLWKHSERMKVRESRRDVTNFRSQMMYTQPAKFTLLLT